LVHSADSSSSLQNLAELLTDLSPISCSPSFGRTGRVSPRGLSCARSRDPLSFSRRAPANDQPACASGISPSRTKLTFAPPAPLPQPGVRTTGKHSSSTNRFFSLPAAASAAASTEQPSVETGQQASEISDALEPISVSRTTPELLSRRNIPPQTLSLPIGPGNVVTAAAFMFWSCRAHDSAPPWA